MPLYEYQCARCRKIFELLIRSAVDEKNIACPHCQNKKVTKQLSTFRMGGAGGKPAGSPGAPQGLPLRGANRGNDSAGSPSGKSGCSSCASGSCSTCH